MFPELQKFIEENIDLIEAGDFDQLYKMDVDYPKFTQVLLEAGINPLKNLTYVPNNYICETDIKEFVVPSHITRIGPSAFWSCEILNKVVLPEGLIFIDDDAFAECHNLWQINLPSTLEYIKDDAFAETNLHHVVIPDLVKLIPRHCFEDCKQLETVKLGKFCYRVGERAFGECDKLRYVQLNEGLEEIGAYAFADCFSLKALYIPSTVKKIQQSPFSNIRNIKVLCVENSYAHNWCEENNQKYELI